MRILKKRNGGSSKVVLLLKLLILRWHCSIKSLGTVLSAANLKWNRHLTCLNWTSHISSSGDLWKTISICKILAPLLQWKQQSMRAFKWSPCRNVLSLWSTIPAAFNIASNWSVDINIYSVSQKWVHPSHFCRYLSISLHGTTLIKWHFDSMIPLIHNDTELIYFSHKITQNITIKS